jgi:hypothetical protein
LFDDTSRMISSSLRNFGGLGGFCGGGGGEGMGPRLSMMASALSISSVWYIGGANESFSVPVGRERGVRRRSKR